MVADRIDAGRAVHSVLPQRESCADASGIVRRRVRSLRRADSLHRVDIRGRKAQAERVPNRSQLIVATLHVALRVRRVRWEHACPRTTRARARRAPAHDVRLPVEAAS